ncbi:MAG: outer membrane lipid asymmetry maintenance protein MlaD [Alphaproteobacteria bacterium]
MRRNMVETVLGAVVVLAAAGFVFFATQTVDLGTPEGYSISARFLKVGGLEPGSDVRISGVKVGTITGRDLDAASFEAVVTMTLDPAIKLPTDTEAVITGEGLLGGKYLRLIPGQESDVIAAGGELLRTRDFKSLEDSVSEIIFLATGG